MKRLILGSLVLVLNSSIPVYAQNAAINDLKGKIFDAKMAQQTFAGGLKHCSELNGTNFYLQPRDRVLDLESYHRSLDSMVAEGVFNPETKKPWNGTDANARWEKLRKQAIDDKAKCALVASLPELQKKLEDLEEQTKEQKK